MAFQTQKTFLFVLVLFSSLLIIFFNYSTSANFAILSPSLLDKYANISFVINQSNSYELCNYKIPVKSSYVHDIKKEAVSFEQIEMKLKNLSINLINGGKSFTQINSNCLSNNSDLDELKNIAIIIPYRNRLDNLKGA